MTSSARISMWSSSTGEDANELIPNSSNGEDANEVILKPGIAALDEEDADEVVAGLVAVDGTSEAWDGGRPHPQHVVHVAFGVTATSRSRWHECGLKWKSASALTTKITPHSKLLRSSSQQVHWRNGCGLNWWQPQPSARGPCCARSCCKLIAAGSAGVAWNSGSPSVQSVASVALEVAAGFVVATRGCCKVHRSRRH